MRQRDYFTKKAVKEGYRARSSFKLKQINQKYNLIKHNSSVLDLGCWPGGWLVAMKEMTRGRLVGIDLVKINPIEGVEFIRGDITSEEIQNRISGKFDVVVSDLAPKTSGIRDLDIGRSIDLSSVALGIAKKFLNPGGSFICKVFQGEGFEDFLNDVRRSFVFCKSVKPEASRKESKEIYIVAKGFKAP